MIAGLIFLALVTIAALAWWMAAFWLLWNIASDAIWYLRNGNFPLFLAEMVLAVVMILVVALFVAVIA